MKIYHGSLEIVEKPEIRIPNRTLDYGYGFYQYVLQLQSDNHHRMFFVRKPLQFCGQVREKHYPVGQTIEYSV